VPGCPPEPTRLLAGILAAVSSRASQPEKSPSVGSLAKETP